MQRLALTLSLALGLFALPAAADLPPPDVEGCNGKATGASCKTDDGRGGLCAMVGVERPDYSNGPPPTYTTVQMLVCVASAQADAKAAAPADERLPSKPASDAPFPPWLVGLGLVVIAVGAYLWSRRPRTTT